jgi:prolyl-tRNA synthetase
MIDMPKPPERKVWSENYSDWFHKVIAEIPVYDTRYPVKGTGVWTPFGFKIRNAVTTIMREELGKTGHDEVLFPLLIPDYMLNKEGEHIKSFESEVFWVTHGGTTPLDVKLALRPTSETSIYPMFKLWVNAYSDLPIKVFQIVNVFRYETKATRPMIRVREVSTFKEAHTVHATREEAEAQVRQGVEIYSRILSTLRIPAVISLRPEWDKFPGAEYTIAFDTILPDGKVLQIGTVHFLGQGFAKAFDIKYMRSDNEYEYVWQNCYGISERLIAALISVHGDDHGLVLPSRAAPVQVAVVPIVYKEREDEVVARCRSIKEELISEGFRVVLDDRKEITPGSKYFTWEQRGASIRIDLGPRDLDAGTIVLVRRDTLEKKVIQANALSEEIKAMLAAMDVNLAVRAETWMRERQSLATSIEGVKKKLDAAGGIIEVPWCGEKGCGEEMEVRVDARILGAPFAGGAAIEGRRCAGCGKPASKSIRIGRSY